MKDYIELTKPRITWLILMSTGIGYYFGLTGAADWVVLLHTLIGTGLLASGTATLNQWYERDADARMRRTERRPLPSGRIRPRDAFLYGLLLVAAGMLELAFGVNMLAAIIGFATVASYLCLYTPMKQRTWWSTTVGAFPGAMPPLIGYAAAHGRLTPEAWTLFAIVFLWQFPHFYAIAWMYRDDYARAGIQMLPVVEPDGRSTARQILLFALLLLPVSLLPGFLRMSGFFYLGAALLLGLWFLRSARAVALERSYASARGVLRASVLYLPLLYAALILDRGLLGR
ncbi:MAG: protoheme IX farnesyltransferase [Bryobacterales bacterium]|nr:protoheme IX farnesyltransferase [Bryobacterales bacterium]